LCQQNRFRRCHQLQRAGSRRILGVYFNPELAPDGRKHDGRRGQLLNNEAGAVDETGVYATTGYVPGYSDQITINFASGVDRVSFEVTNNSAGTFWVSDNVGDYYSGALDNNGTGTFTLGGDDITYVTISESAAGSNLFNFAIDDVDSNIAGKTGFSVPGAATPEPGSLTLLATGLGSCVTVLRRRKIAR
jgi:hypothetical protein